MQIHISPRHVQLTAAIHAHVADKVAHLEEFCDTILAAHVVLLFDEHKSKKKDYQVKIHLALPGPDLHAEDAEDEDIELLFDDIDGAFDNEEYLHYEEYDDIGEDYDI
jgi:putative sigma-54 modulation protein